MTESKKIKIGIVGGAGYTAGELIRILLNHPFAQIVSIVSTSNAGNPITKIHDDLLGETEWVFQEKLSGEEEVVFLCLGHGNSAEFLSKTSIKPETKIIDLSNDFRLKKDQIQGDRTFVYGLPEMNKSQIKNAQNIANPGCFATSIQLALLPLAKNNLINDSIHISAITGSTGAGRELISTTGFTWRESNASTYKEFTHQHLGEIRESLGQLQPNFNKQVYFIPYRGNFTRGILSSVYTKCEKPLEEIIDLYKSYYQNEPFTIVSNKAVNIKQVTNTNKCLLYLQKHENQLLISSVIDNLTKGAAGQAIQNMNLLFGLAENEGLSLKPVAF